jgi:hypothetical protein
MTPGFLVGVAVLAYLVSRAGERTRPARQQGIPLWQRWVGFGVVVLAVLIVVTPEFAALGLLGDTAFFDLLVLLLGLQLHAIGAQARCWVTGLVSRVLWWIMAPRISYLVALSTWTALAGLGSQLRKIVQRVCLLENRFVA